MADDLDPLGAEFVEVNTVVNPATAAKKNPAGGTLSPTGRFQVNMEGTDIMDGVAKVAGLPQTHYYARFRVNAEHKTVAVLAVDADMKGATEVRRSADNKTITLYLHGVFKEHADLRPDSETEVKITLHPSGKAAVINLASGGLSLRHTTRDSSGQTSAAR